MGNTGKCHFLAHICYFEHFKMVFMKYWSWVKLFSKTRSTFWEKKFSIPCPVFDVWRHLLTSFCNISLIWPFNHIFEQLDLIFPKYLCRESCSTWPAEHFGKISVWYQMAFLTYAVICDVFLLYFTNFPLNLLFEQLDLIFTKYLWG